MLFGNLECTLSEAGLRPADLHSLQMRGHPDYVRGLVSTGFSVVNLANNHSMQHGRQPFLETVGLLRNAGIQVCGLRATEHEGCVPVVLEKNTLRVVVLGFCLRPRQYFSEQPLYAEGRPAEMIQEVARARLEADVVLVSLHWGDEFIERPSPEEIDLAHGLVDSGADLIIGHHPHVLRGIEAYGGGFIAYSLGNFVCDMLWGARERESGILECRLTKSGVSHVKLIPTRINDQCRPEPMNADATSAQHVRMQRLSDQLSQCSPGPPEAQELISYRVAAELAQRDHRKAAHRYFARNLLRCPPGIILQQLKTYARNRLASRSTPAQAHADKGCSRP